MVNRLDPDAKLPSHPPGHELAGFDQEFSDITDYIVRITERIWEGGQVELCQRYYSTDCPVYTLTGLTIGADQVTHNTRLTQQAFPDRELHADAIIWNGDASAGFHTSHRISSPMTNLGTSEFGPATGRHAKINVIAHCVCRNNRIIEEWLVRDNYSLALQLGLDPLAVARRWAGKEAEPAFEAWRDAEIARVDSATADQMAHAGLPHQDPRRQLAESIEQIWNQHQFDRIASMYDSNAKFHGSAGHEYDQASELGAFYRSFTDALPDLRASIDYVCSVPSPAQSQATDVALRWTLAGTHQGGQHWGQPSNAAVLVMGESHYRLLAGKVVEEWAVFDQLAVLTQIERSLAAA